MTTNGQDFSSMGNLEKEPGSLRPNDLFVERRLTTLEAASKEHATKTDIVELKGLIERELKGLIQQTSSEIRASSSEMKTWFLSSVVGLLISLLGLTIAAVVVMLSLVRIFLK